ncbi:amino acid adenylation domain-containing protein [Serratia liquefaciens]
MNLVSLFSKVCAQAPDLPAVRSGQQEISYRTLDALSQRAAQVLRAQKVGPGSVVAIDLPRSIELAVTVLAVLKAGASYLCLDAQAPDSRIVAMLAEQGNLVMIGLPQGRRLANCFLSVDELWADSIAQHLPQLTDADNCACLFYTSGSTGRPKGVRVTHQGVVRMAHQPDYVQIQHGDRIAGLANPAFDAFNFEIWGAWLNGACWCLFETEDLRSPHIFARLLKERQIDTMFVTAALFHLMISEVPAGFTTLRTVLAGGDILDPTAVRTFLKHHPQTKLVNAYGPTECATFAACYAVPKNFDATSVPIGQPIRETAWRILDESGQPVAQGTFGELYLTGQGLAEGYHHLPEETAKRFVTFSTPDGSIRAYRTGDIVRMNEEGMLEISGRIDGQVKLRGFRIELSEIEHALCLHPAIRQASVIAVDKGMDKQLAAFVVGESVSVGDCRDWLTARLPTYMIPHNFVLLDSLPLNANSKVDRERLRHTLLEEEVTDVEVSVFERLCRKVLNATGWDMSQSFIQAGGDSLQAMRLIAQLEQQGRTFSLRDVLACSSLRQLEQQWDQGGADHPGYPRLNEAPMVGATPASSEQQRLWLIQTLHPTSRAYHTPFVFTLEGELVPARLQEAVQALVNRHHALRSRFVHDDAQGLLQLAVPDVIVELPIVELGAEGSSMDWRRLADSFFNQPFDLQNGPLFRSCLIRLADNSWVWLMNAHHIVLDGQSMNVLLAEISEQYIGGERPPSSVRYDYSDYCVWQQQFHASDSYSQQIAFWEKWHHELETNEMRPLASDDEHQGHLHTFRLGAPETAALKRLARERNMTLFSLLLSCFGLVLADFRGTRALTLATPQVNRPLPIFENMIGMFANTLPLRLDFDRDVSLSEILDNTHASILSAQMHQDVAYQHVVDAQTERTRNGEATLFDTMFVLENMDISLLALPGVRARWVPYDSGTAKFPLLLAMTENEDGLQGGLEYQTKQILAEQVAYLAEAYSALLAQLPYVRLDQPLGDVPFWRGAGSPPCWHPLCGPRRDLPFTSLGQWFEAQTELTPQQMAIQHGPHAMNYRTLNQRVNQLARYMRRTLDLQRGDTVALYSAPSIDAIVGVLALTKLGVGTLLLDATYPTAVLSRILSQAPVKAVLHAAVLSGDTLLADWPERSCITLGSIALWKDESGDNLPPVATGEDLLYTVYTSGSTGLPKGCEVRQQTLINLLNWQFETLGLKSVARTLQFSALTFDVAMQEIHGTLCGGGTLVLIDPEIKQDHVALLHFIAEQQIERIFLPYVALQSLAEVALALHSPPRGLREVVTAGEQLYCGESIRAFFQASPDALLINMYGPSETHVVSGYVLRGPASAWETRPPIGTPIDNVTMYVLNEQQKPLPQGITGEIAVSGLPIRPCYNNHPAANQERFPSLFLEKTVQQVYLTGDLGFVDRNGQMVFVERKDHQLKVNGYRIECGHIEAALLTTGLVEVAAVMVESGELIAYVQFLAEATPDREALLMRLSEQLPSWMLPAEVRLPETFVKTPSGKIDRKAMVRSQWKTLTDAKAGCALPTQTSSKISSSTNWQQRIAVEVEQVLGHPINAYANFFDAGFNSLSLVKLHVRLLQAGADGIRLVDLFSHPSCVALACHLVRQQATLLQSPQPEMTVDSVHETGIAIIGMALNVPGAANLGQFWQNVVSNRESIEIQASMTDISCDHSHFVSAKASLEGVFDFDPAYFGISEQEGCMMDPQQRHILMGAVQALDHAGYNKSCTTGRIGVMVSAGENHYQHQLAQLALDRSIDPVLMALYQEKDFLATKLAYYLDLKGPAITIQTACSSSLVAVQQACLNLQSGECDLALAGGVMIDPTVLDGYTYKPGHIFSADGHCKPFSDEACGTLGGNGFGLVVLKSLASARRDGDTIYAVISGGGINNDGNTKVGYTAPSVNGQAEAIRLALRRAGVQPSQVGYVEAHGTATPLGDPIEVEALKQAFNLKTEKPFCALASVKSQIGHLGAAAGVVGLIRATLALYHRVLPPNLGFTSLNPSIELENSPFYINPHAKLWQSDTPRIAGVSSFGMGGTNCHITLSEAPVLSFPQPKEMAYTLMFTAHSQIALYENLLQVWRYLMQPKSDLSSIARALQRRATHGKWRVSESFCSRDEAISGLPDMLNRIAYVTEPLSVENARMPGCLPWDLPPYTFVTAQYALEGVSDTPLKQPMMKWLYEPVWQPMVGLGIPLSTSGTCLLFGDENWPASALADALDQQGWQIMQADLMADIPSILNRLPASDGPWTVCLALSDVSQDTYHQLMGWAQVMLRHFAEQPVTLLLFTRQAGHIGNNNETVKPAAALLHGLINVLPQEVQQWKAVWVDWPLVLPDDWAQEASGLVMAAPANGAYAWHAHQTWRLEHHPVAFPPMEIPEILKPDVYLIFGGLGGMGRALTERLACLLPGSHFILLGRSVADQTLPVVPGCSTEALSCDMADAISMEQVARELADRHPRIGGIFHFAGAPGGTMLPWCTKEIGERVLAAKVLGCQYLQQYFMALSPRFVVYSSSMSAILGGVGQSDYSAANAFLNAWAQKHDIPEGCRHISIGWDVWKDTGMTLFSDSRQQVAHRQVGLGPDQGLWILLAALRLGKPQLMVSTTPLELAGKFYDGQLAVAKSAILVAPESPGFSREAVREMVETLLGINVSDDRQELYDYGIDSLQALDLLDGLNSHFHCRLTLNAMLATFTVDHLYQLIGTKLTPPVASPLQCVREGDPEQVIVLIHPIGGDVLAYRELIAQLDHSVTLYTLQDPRLLQQGQEDWSITQRAGHYLRWLEALPKNATVQLVGWSFGGLVAQEMACQAELDGHPVCKIALIDPPSPLSGGDLTDEIGAQMLTAFRKELEEKFGPLDHWDTPDAMIAQIASHANGQATVYARLLYEACASNMRSMACHRPSVLKHTPVLLFQASDKTPGLQYEGEALLPKWQRFVTQPMQYVCLVGDHYTILKGKAAQQLAGELASSR